jgi:hypothetical protein
MDILMSLEVALKNLYVAYNGELAKVKISNI